MWYFCFWRSVRDISADDSFPCGGDENSSAFGGNDCGLPHAGRSFGRGKPYPFGVCSRANRAALELAEDEGFREMRQDILGKLEALPSMSEGRPICLRRIWRAIKTICVFLDIMELWYRDLLTAKSLREEGYLIQRDKKGCHLSGGEGACGTSGEEGSRSQNRTNASGTECKFSADDGSHADGFKGDW